ncbi:MAG: hypothetical protein CMF48_03405 [Legionellales bacterium]|nr:hypothetical protein [Legionellales bacterium]|tara:strand:+ start:87 stop:305 length:219 start_codon:yes stop_codon:yes gene_type:complete
MSNLSRAIQVLASVVVYTLLWIGIRQLWFLLQNFSSLAARELAFCVIAGCVFAYANNFSLEPTWLKRKNKSL